ncbi:MAG: protein-disulfide reductase DsbD domain-containing protein [Pseudomonadota bacterium]|nr:protein-disulfide reductase DsbD domain-containing protein [Pseudomonadota bacterium]
MIIKVKKLIEKNLKKYFVIVPIFAVASFTLPTESFLEKITNNNVLSSDEAFIFSAYIQDDESIILTWTIKENCFLYKDKFKTYADTDLVEDQKIEGEAIRINDIYFGNVDVFYNSVIQTIDKTEDLGSIKVVYQGCNEKGFCYPPISKEIQVDNLENF